MKIVTWILSVLIGLFAPAISSAQTCAPLNPSIVSWWPGEGDAADIIDDNPGILEGGVTFDAGMVGQAFSLDGSNGLVNLGNAANLQVSAGDFSVEVWVRFNTLDRGFFGDMSIVDKMGRSGPNDDGWRMIKQRDHHFWFCLGGVGTNGCTPSAPTTVISRTSATVGPWFHVAGVKGDAGIAVYVNGVKEDSKPLAPFNDTNSAEVLIGSYNREHSFLDGSVDEVSIYNSALSDSDIQAIFDAGSDGKCQP